MVILGNHRLSSFALSALTMGIRASVFRMADDAPAAPAAAPVTIEAPAEHQSLLERAVALLKTGEQYVIDNIEAGLSTLEQMVGIGSNNDAKAAMPADEETK